MYFNSHMGLDLCFQLIHSSLIWYASFTNEIFGQLLSNYNRYAANLNMKAVSFFLLTLYTNSNYFGMHCKLTEIISAKITQAVQAFKFGRVAHDQRVAIKILTGR